MINKEDKSAYDIIKENESLVCKISNLDKPLQQQKEKIDKLIDLGKFFMKKKKKSSLYY